MSAIVTRVKELNFMYVLNVLISITIAVVLAPMYINLLNDQVPFLASDYGKFLKFLAVTFLFVTLISLVVPSFAAYDETDKQLTAFLKSHNVVGAPSFRS